MNNEKLIPSPDFMYKQAKEAFEILELKKKQREEERRKKKQEQIDAQVERCTAEISEEIRCASEKGAFSYQFGTDVLFRPRLMPSVQEAVLSTLFSRFRKAGYTIKVSNHQEYDLMLITISWNMKDKE